MLPDGVAAFLLQGGGPSFYMLVFPAEKFNLTDRELEILVAMADGLTLQQIALKFSIALTTVKYHSANIFRKLGAQNRSEALVVALKNNLI